MLSPLCDSDNGARTHIRRMCQPRVWGAESPSSLPDNPKATEWVLSYSGETCSESLWKKPSIIKAELRRGMLPVEGEKLKKEY